MFLGRDDMGDGEILEPRARILDRLDLEADRGQLLGDSLGVGLGLEMILQPGERELHGARSTWLSPRLRGEYHRRRGGGRRHGAAFARPPPPPPWPPPPPPPGGGRRPAVVS